MNRKQHFQNSRTNPLCNGILFFLDDEMRNWATSKFSWNFQSAACIVGIVRDGKPANMKQIPAKIVIDNEMCACLTA